jgi:hypothetical protein
VRRVTGTGTDALLVAVHGGGPGRHWHWQCQCRRRSGDGSVGRQRFWFYLLRVAKSAAACGVCEAVVTSSKKRGTVAPRPEPDVRVTSRTGPLLMPGAGFSHILPGFPVAEESWQRRVFAAGDSRSIPQGA